MTDVFTGWPENVALRNGAHRWVLEALTLVEGRLPFPLVGLDTDNEGEFINHALVQVRWNLFTATSKATGWRSNKNGKNTRVYDKPRTPYQRVLDTGIMTADTAARYAALFEAANPAEVTRQITRIQTRLIALARDKTAALSRANSHEAPDHISRAS